MSFVIPEKAQLFMGLQQVVGHTGNPNKRDVKTLFASRYYGLVIEPCQHHEEEKTMAC